jgi:carboxymethylenebutenolidase
MSGLVEGMVEVPTPAGLMPSYLARMPEADPMPAVLVMMEGVGLNAHLRDVTRRLAAEGYAALAPDLYWRGGTGRSVGYDQIRLGWKMMGELYSEDGTPRGEWLREDVGGAIAFLRAQPFVRPDRIGVTGFCLGGRITIDVAACFPELISAAAPFYGAGIPFHDLEKLRAPFLGFYGGGDPFIPLGDVERLKRDLERLGKQAEVVVYPSATHGFFCDDRPSSYNPEAASDAWERLKGFFSKHLKGRGGADGR